VRQPSETARLVVCAFCGAARLTSAGGFPTFRRRDLSRAKGDFVMRILRSRRAWAFPALFALVACVPAAAEGPPGPSPQANPSVPPIAMDRFSMTPAQNGFLRLDKQTGAVSYCTIENGLSACRVGADERVALEEEIARLRRENAELKAARGPAQGSGSALPRDEEFERALSFAERFMRRMMRVFKEEAPGDRS